MKKNILVILLMLFIFPVIINAEKCDEKEIVRLKTAASKIEAKLVPISFPELIKSADTEEEYLIERNYFSVRIDNLTDDFDYVLKKKTLVIWNSKTDGFKDTYTYDVLDKYDSVRNIELAVTSKGCEQDVQRTVSVTLPMRNPYYEYDMCNDIHDFYLCQEFWYQDYTGTDVRTKIEQYQNNEIDKDGKKKDKKSLIELINGFVKKYYIVLISVLVVILGIGLFTYIRYRIRIKKHFG